MSWMPDLPPRDQAAIENPHIEHIWEARPRDLGGFTVGRALPSAQRRMVGPFIFFDHMGPATLGAGHGVDVRPHPHINLATVTYLFAGEVEHKDSLGSHQTIKPGAVNWMTAGHGIVHSERTPLRARAGESELHGLQLWVALPRAHEEDEPSFVHHAAATLPVLDETGVYARLLAGTAYGINAPVKTLSPLFYIDLHLTQGAGMPLPRDHDEKAIYVVDGVVSVGAERIEPRRMVVFGKGAQPTIYAETTARVMLLGGARLDGERHIWWNFVSSSPARIEAAKADWASGKFPKVAGDDEFIPLPEQ